MRMVGPCIIHGHGGIGIRMLRQRYEMIAAGSNIVINRKPIVIDVHFRLQMLQTEPHRLRGGYCRINIQRGLMAQD